MKLQAFNCLDLDFSASGFDWCTTLMNYYVELLCSIDWWSKLSSFEQPAVSDNAYLLSSSTEAVWVEAK